MKSKRVSKNPDIVHHIHQTIKKSTWMAREVVHFTGIPVAYSETVAWFAERVFLGAICIATAAFAFGIVFALYWSAPIAETQTYNFIADQASIAKSQFIDMASPVFQKLLRDNYMDEDVELDKLKAQLKEYLTSKKSPFAQDDATLTALAQAKNMKMIIAISFVESNFGKHCYYYNCSGIGGSVPGLRKYESYAAWVQDFDSLLERRYKDLPVEKFIGLYVQPGSPNWLRGVRQVLEDFRKLEIG